MERGTYARGIIVVSSPYTPPDPPYGGVRYSSPCEYQLWTCTYDPDYWLPGAGYYTPGGDAPDGFPPDIWEQLNSHEKQLLWEHPLAGVRVYLAKRDAEQWATAIFRRRAQRPPRRATAYDVELL
jgi:hypothetical protein